MAAQVYSQAGLRLDVVGRKGDDIGIFNVAATNADGTVAVLTGTTFTGKITDDTGTHVGDVAFDTTNLATGILRYWFANATTAALDATPVSQPTKYSYSIEGTFTDGLIKPMYYGSLRLLQGDGK